ncbi:quinone-dependent dihydroorotate dehydrogenase [Companilactobacillus allii]|uniref:Dihydroorotate dehydrogenase (quinone) n=1 Tax=Companilactobacillus allii TaxID=1847728 RepID=A0A1P8Q572_9LACO|nr:quinone-dependent dihydroorotate dehydrogenase [Companilactobacillus allii]APX73000.1 dihydroorotate dehydrogenase (quinone) [Companilactobacillus allii]USQ67797.1 quinone-dependent dihydroorotate dehydrogenase [Companilactobacillus allii]
MDLYKLARPLIFSIDPEKDHHLVANGLKIFNKNPKILRKMFYTKKRPNLSVTIKNLTFDSPIGIAAGFDKKAEFYNSLGALGAGFVEVGSVTKKAQAGNKKKRVFRLPEDKAIINRMGLNNDGIKITKDRLKNQPANDVKIGLSIAPSHGLNDTGKVLEMIESVKEIHDQADYIALNISCPNQKGVATLQHVELLTQILTGIKELNIDEPVFCKFGNDIDTNELIATLHSVENLLDGVILTNTSGMKRDNLVSIDKKENGGLSGKPLFETSIAMTKLVHEQFPHMPIIYSGGVFTPEDAKTALKSGASLVEVYTGFIYNGPTMIERINRSLSEEQMIKELK